MTEGGGSPPAAGFRSGFVAIVGRPNVGKSTLLNALVGEKVAIVSPKPQTTRRRILGIVTTDAAQVVFVDTPGIHKPTTALGRRMVATAREAIPDADVVLFVVDVSVPPTDQDRAVAGAVRGSGRPVVLALNKSDRLSPQHVLENTSAYGELAGTDAWMLTIATEGRNLDRLWSLVLAVLPEGPPFYPADQVTDQTDRMLVGELVREAALRKLREEVPHGIEVAVTDWQVQESGVLRIDATVYVERASHKGMVIGAGGATIKAIGTAARREIERLLESQVFLGLHVKVRSGWRRSAEEVRRLGFD